MARCMVVILGCILLLQFAKLHVVSGVRYQPNWDSLDKRPLPQWYDEGKFGIFMHWGVFSVPSYTGAWFWYWWKGPAPMPAVVEFMVENYRPDFTYADFAPEFTAEFFDPDKWADILAASGARYFVLTTKHHEGYCLWPSKYSWNWNAMDVGPNRDLVGDLANSIRKRTSLRFGVYHSLFEFFNPLYLQDKANNFTTNDFVAFKTMPELLELVYNYKPDIIWSDGEWEANSTYWNSTNFLAWLYNDSPVKDTVVTNDRWGSETICKHGGFFSCSDNYNPKTLQKHKFEDATTVDNHAWEFRRNLKLDDVHSPEELVATLVETVSCGGNLLLNVGPTKEGTIVPIFEERLRQMGQWLKVNGEAIYGTRPWLFQNDTIHPTFWYTSKKQDSGNTTVYAIALEWPSMDVLLGAPVPSAQTMVSLLGYSQPISWVPGSFGGLQMSMPVIPINEMPCQWAWVFKLDNLKNSF